MPSPITSRSNERVKALRASLGGKAARSGDLLGIEGLHLLGELHHAGHSFDTVYLREGDESVLEVGWPSRLRAEHRVVLSREVFDTAVTTATPQGIAATWSIQEPRPAPGQKGNVLLLENLQDPGNVGTLVRSAEAFGFTEVRVTTATANQWNPKVVRASAGSVFRLPVLRQSLQAMVADLRQGPTRLFAAVGSFLGEPALADSIGVLTGRRLAQKSMAHEMQGQGYPASLSPDTDFLEPCAILIGNEGAGLSPEARALADEQVRIPCHAESLNAAVAGSVLMYEVMRQASLRAWARAEGLRP